MIRNFQTSSITKHDYLLKWEVTHRMVHSGSRGNTRISMFDIKSVSTILRLPVQELEYLNITETSRGINFKCTNFPPHYIIRDHNGRVVTPMKNVISNFVHFHNLINLSQLFDIFPKLNDLKWNFIDIELREQ